MLFDVKLVVFRCICLCPYDVVVYRVDDGVLAHLVLSFFKVRIAMVSRK